MRTTGTLAAGIVAVGIVGLAMANVASADEVHVTVYNNDLALVKETRRVELPGGGNQLGLRRAVNLDSVEGTRRFELHQDVQLGALSRGKGHGG